MTLHQYTGISHLNPFKFRDDTQSNLIFRSFSPKWVKSKSQVAPTMYERYKYVSEKDFPMWADVAHTRMLEG